MRRTLLLQKGVVLPSSALITLILIVLPLSSLGQTTRLTDLKNNVRQTAAPNNLAQRIDRIESGRLPPAVLKCETPARMKLPGRREFYKTPAGSIALITHILIE